MYLEEIGQNEIEIKELNDDIDILKSEKKKLLIYIINLIVYQKRTVN
jgi:hypothetical protein